MTASGPSSSGYVDAAVELAIEIHEKEGDGHILIFLTGQDEIDRACHQIRSKCSDEHIIVLPLYAALSASVQHEIFRKYRSKDGRLMRKCIVATNIAETSITVPMVRYVIDCGYVKQKTYNPDKHMESLIVVPISQVAAQQRAGRAGRTGPGRCYRLYSSECYQNMMEETVPEILRTNLANTLLYLKVLGIEDVLAFEFLDPPSEAQILEALMLLHMLQAIDDVGFVTDVGKSMSKLPLDPRLSRAILAASNPECRCVREVVIIAAMLSVESIWQDLSKYQKKAMDSRAFLEVKEERQAHLRHPSGDYMTYLRLFERWENEERSSREWCEDFYVNFKSMINAKKIRFVGSFDY